MFFIYGCHLLNKLVNDLFMKACGTYLLNNLQKEGVFNKGSWPWKSFCIIQKEGFLSLPQGNSNLNGHVFFITCNEKEIFKS